METQHIRNDTSIDRAAHGGLPAVRRECRTARKASPGKKNISRRTDLDALDSFIARRLGTRPVAAPTPEIAS